MNSDEKHLIKNTTKEEREKIIRDAIAISMLDAEAPSEKGMKFYQMYIDGKMELDDIAVELIKMYKRN